MNSNFEEEYQKYLQTRCITLKTARFMSMSNFKMNYCSFYWVRHAESESSFIIHRLEFDKLPAKIELDIFPAYTFEELYDFIECEYYFKKSLDPSLTYHCISRKTGNSHNGRTALEALEKLVFQKLSYGESLT